MNEMDTIQSLIDILRDAKTPGSGDVFDKRYGLSYFGLSDIAEDLQKALDRKNRAIEHLKYPMVSMAQTRRLVEQAKAL